MLYLAIASAKVVRARGYLGGVFAVNSVSAGAAGVADCATDCVGACRQAIAISNATVETKDFFITGLRTGAST
jgi:hypothetical protein